MEDYIWQLRWHGEPYESANRLLRQRVPDAPTITPTSTVYEIRLTPEDCQALTRGMRDRYRPRQQNIPVICVRWRGLWLIDGRNRCNLAHREGRDIQAAVIDLESDTRQTAPA
jgi:hypothetical protein